MKVAIILTVLLASALTVPLPPVDRCSPFPADWIGQRACLSQQIGTARNVPGNNPIKSQPGALCSLGYHKMDDYCHPNTAYCVDKKYDSQTFNCTECKWYAFQVQGDLTHFPDFTGDYCRTRWWYFVLLLLLAITALLLFFALLRFLFCRPKVNIEKKPLIKTHHEEVEVEVHHERPDRVVRGEVREWRDEPVVTEHRSGVSHGQRVHVETRTYSPNREVQRVSHGHEDWARWSQANWQGH